MTVTKDRTNVESFSGLFLDYLNPQPEQITIDDVARGLSTTCRFAGQVNRFYSVAEHGCYVRQLVIEAGRPDLSFAALHHDSHEAWLGDWPSPLKHVFDSDLYRSIARNIDGAIAQRFGIDEDFKHPAIKQADEYAMRREAATLKYSHGAGEHWGYDEPFLPLAGIGWFPDKAEREFLRAHQEEISARG